MSDALTFAELDVQQVELLPARTVMSMFQLGSTGGSGTGGTGTGGAGGDAHGGIGVNALNFNVGSGNQYNSAGDAYGGPGGAGTGGPGTGGASHLHIHHPKPWK